MSERSRAGVEALTEKEKQTLRLIVRGHDAKSVARSLDLSVHTINERLRDARRKLAVSSSREAARLLLDAEGDRAGSTDPQSLGDARMGEAALDARVHPGPAPVGGAARAIGPGWIIIGVALMSLALGLLALTALPQAASTPPATPPAAAQAVDPQVVKAARAFLALLDQSRWDESYRATAASFRKLNTLEVWAAASEKARPPLGAMLSRTLISQENLPAPPSGYEVVKFRTRFADKAETVETVSLIREDGAWRVAGVMIG